MGVIISIDRVERWQKNNINHARTYATVDSETHGIVELAGYGDAYKVGDEVQVLFDDKWNTAKMQKTVHN
jgi:hypothetical protein